MTTNDLSRQVPPDSVQQVRSDLAFSASSLQDYLDCPRRFQLQYILNLAWPAAEAEPLEEAQARSERGQRFHRAIHSHSLGVPIEAVAGSLTDPVLAGWWEAFLEHRPRFPDALWFHEVGLSSPLGNHRLTARYDAVVVERTGPVHILDWKTYQRRPKREKLRLRAQTRLYPLLLVAAGGRLCGGEPLQPKAVEMVYWFTVEPQRPERFNYSQAMRQEDEQYVRELVTEIVERRDETWPLTEEARRCNYCVYRSLCDRGVKPGSVDDWEMPEELDEDLADLEWGQAQEMAY
jgi:RecB family exonuclease